MSTDLINVIKEPEAHHDSLVIHRDTGGYIIKIVNNKHNVSLEWLSEKAFIAKMNEMNAEREKNAHN